MIRIWHLGLPDSKLLFFVEIYFFRSVRYDKDEKLCFESVYLRASVQKHGRCGKIFFFTIQI